MGAANVVTATAVRRVKMRFGLIERPFLGESLDHGLERRNHAGMTRIPTESPTVGQTPTRRGLPRPEPTAQGSAPPRLSDFRVLSPDADQQADSEGQPGARMC